MNKTILRRRYYRDHKYVINKLIEFQLLVSQTDFKAIPEVRAVIDGFKNLVSLIECHAEHEHKAIIELLRQKQSTVGTRFEKDHARQHELFKRLLADLLAIEQAEEIALRISKGYQFYLDYMLFFGDSLKHMHAEENILMKELQRLYSDEALAAIEFKTYDIMTPQEMLHMFHALFPQIDTNDKEAFITDIHTWFPEKLSVIWTSVTALLSVDEAKYFETHLNIQAAEQPLGNETTLYYAWEETPQSDGELVLTQHQRDSKDFENTLKDIFEQEEEVELV